MADFSCASTKRTSQAPMSCEAPVRFHVSVVVPALVLTSCNATKEVNLLLRTAPGSSPARTTILTIPSATHRTTPGTAALAVEAGRGPLAGRNRQSGGSSSKPQAHGFER
jgi:hypothetical protein